MSFNGIDTFLIKQASLGYFTRLWILNRGLELIKNCHKFTYLINRHKQCNNATLNLVHVTKHKDMITGTLYKKYQTGKNKEVKHIKFF